MFYAPGVLDKSMLILSVVEFNVIVVLGLFCSDFTKEFALSNW